MKTATPVTIFSLTAFVGLMAANGRAFFDAFAALPDVLSKFSTLMPLGTGSFFLSMLLAAVAWYFIHRLPVPTRTRAAGHEFRAELFALVVGVAAMLLQNAVAPGHSRAAASISATYAVMLGILAGFAAPFFMKGVLAAWNRFLHTDWQQ
jgi:hypothetical protein